MNFYLHLLSLAIFTCLSQAVVAEDLVELTNRDGKNLQVKLLQLHEGVLRFENPENTKEYSMPLASLTESSQKRVEDWKAAGGGLSTNFRIAAQLVRANVKSKVEDYDDRQVTMVPKIIVSNMNTGIPSSSLSGIMMIFGRPVQQQRQLVVLSKEARDLGTFQKGEKREIVFNAVQIVYDNKKAAQYGNQYYGYAFFLLKDGKVIASEGEPRSILSKDSALFVPMREGEQFQN